MTTSKMLTLLISPQVLLDLILISSCIQTVLADGTITITAAPAYSSLLPCAQECIYSWDLGCPDVPDPIGNAIGCYDNLNAGCNKVSWALDSCYCRSDLQVDAVSAISTCVMSLCTLGDSMDDFRSVSSVYTAYCLGAGFPVNVAAAASTAVTPVTASSTEGTSPISNTSPSAFSPSSSSSSQDNGGSGGGLSPGATAGITVAGFIVAVIGAVIAWRQYSFMKKERREK